MPRPAKSNELLRALEAQLSTLSAGERFPSVRQLMRDYQLSQSPVQDALNRLVETGRLEAKPGRGMYVRGSEPLRRTIAMLSPHWPGAATLEAAAEVERAAASRGWIVKRSTYSIHDNVFARLRTIRADGVIIDPVGSGSVTPEQQALILRSPVPVVMIRSRFACAQINWVSGNDAMIGLMAANHLHAKGHRRVALLISEPHVPTITEMCEGFRLGARQNRQTLTEIDCETLPGTYAPAVAYGCLQAWLEAHSIDFDAIFVTGDDSALAVYKALGEREVRLPEQVSVLGMGNSQAGALYTPALSSVHTDISALTEAAVGILDDWLATGRNPERQANIYPEIVERESVSDALAPAQYLPTPH